MKSFTHNGRQVEFSAVNGTVHGHHKRGDTIVEGSGGGGYDGHTRPVSVSSRVVVKQDFFVEEDSGRQTPVQLSGQDIPLTDGQRVTMISGGTDKGKRWTHLVNHSAQLYWNLNDAKGLVITWGVVRNPFLSFLIGVAIWIASGYVISGLLGFVAAVAYWVYAWLEVRRAAKALEPHLKDLGGEALRSTPPPMDSGAKIAAAS